MNILYLITARGGSKGIPGKNIKPLAGKPLISYSLDVAAELTAKENICISTDSEEIIKVAKQYGFNTPFKRPANLSTDNAGSYEVIKHALDFYENAGRTFNAIILLQPTSPFRTTQHIKDMIALFDESIDMVVSVKKSDANPYYNLFEEDETYFLKRSIASNVTRRQDAPNVYQYNGAIYLINANSLKTNKSFNEFRRIKKYIMPAINSIDIDNEIDWYIAETIIEKKLLNN